MVLGVVALPASPNLRLALQTVRSGMHDPAARLLVKWGLDIRARGWRVSTHLANNSQTHGFHVTFGRARQESELGPDVLGAR